MEMEKLQMQNGVGPSERICRQTRRVGRTRSKGIESSRIEKAIKTGGSPTAQRVAGAIIHGGHVEWACSELQMLFESVTDAGLLPPASRRDGSITIDVVTEPADVIVTRYQIQPLFSQYAVVVRVSFPI